MTRSIIDDWAERHIADAQARGELSALPGEGRPLLLDDDSHVPAELRSGYRLLKNAGCLPPQLEQRREAITLLEMLRGIDGDHPDYRALSKRLALLELRLQQAGLDTAFLRGAYGEPLRRQLGE
ncbi:MAG: DUF1992 domain-containing protein [Edwardsiella piscicida]